MYIPIQLLVSELSNSYLPAFITRQLHALVAKTHLSLDPFFATRLVRFYAMNDELSSARNLFDEMPKRSVYLWNSMIRAYAKAHDFRAAFSTFNRMSRSEAKPDAFTFACVIRASCESDNVGRLRVIHGGAVGYGLGMNHICCSALMSAYAKLGHVDESARVFQQVDDPDVPMWNSMIGGYGYSGFWKRGLRLFYDMRHLGRKPDGYTMVALLLGFTDPDSMKLGQGVHGFCVRSGFELNPHVVSSLVTMYSRCNCLDSAYKAFASLEKPDLVTCSALMSGFLQFGEFKTSLLLFKEMNVFGVKGDPILVVSALAACSHLARVGTGREIHGYILRHWLEKDVVVASALVDMYFKCGFVDSAKLLFEILPRKNTVTYNTAISGLGSCGFPYEAFGVFADMIGSGLKPDQSTLSALLHVCCHAGLVDKGREYFRQLRDEFGVEPMTDHYVYMVRLLGMVGELEEAFGLIKDLAEPIDEGIWGALLACCEAQGDTAMAEMAARHILGDDHANRTSCIVMLSNVYAMNGRWNDAKKVRDKMEDNGQRKTPGLSWSA